MKDKYGNYKRYCSDECKLETTKSKFKSTYANKDMDAILDKRKSTLLQKYGVESPMHIIGMKERFSELSKSNAPQRVTNTRINNLAKYGVESTNSLIEVQEKKKQTLIERYGVDHQLRIPGVAESVAKKNSENAAERLAIAMITKEEKYGDKNYNNRPKYINTCIERFGVVNPSQNAEVHSRKIGTSFKAKEYKFPSGKVVKVQGYECLALDELLKTYNEDEIITATKNIPIFEYADIHGEPRKYFPDIYIPKDNLIVEVKSIWTYTQNKTVADLKGQSCKDAGYNFKLMIMEKK